MLKVLPSVFLFFLSLFSYISKLYQRCFPASISVVVIKKQKTTTTLAKATRKEKGFIQFTTPGYTLSWQDSQDRDLRRLVPSTINSRERINALMPTAQLTFSSLMQFQPMEWMMPPIFRVGLSTSMHTIKNIFSQTCPQTN